MNETDKGFNQGAKALGKGSNNIQGPSSFFLNDKTSPGRRNIATANVSSVSPIRRQGGAGNAGDLDASVKQPLASLNHGNVFN